MLKISAREGSEAAEYSKTPAVRAHRLSDLPWCKPSVRNGRSGTVLCYTGGAALPVCCFTALVAAQRLKIALAVTSKMLFEEYMLGPTKLRSTSLCAFPLAWICLINAWIHTSICGPGVFLKFQCVLCHLFTYPGYLLTFPSPAAPDAS